MVRNACIARELKHLKSQVLQKSMRRKCTVGQKLIPMRIPHRRRRKPTAKLVDQSHPHLEKPGSCAPDEALTEGTQGARNR